MSALRSKSEQRAAEAVRKAMRTALRAAGFPFDVTEVEVHPDGMCTARFSVEFAAALEPAGPEALAERWIALLRQIVLEGACR